MHVRQWVGLLATFAAIACANGGSDDAAVAPGNNEEASWGEIEQPLPGLLVHSTADGQINLLRAFTNYGRGDVDCPADMVALGGGARCTDGELDVTRPKVGYRNGQRVPVGWMEWHRGSSSNDCEVYAVCVPSAWFGPDQIRVVTQSTHYGSGSVDCPPRWKATGGGSYCTDGDLDMAYPNASLSGWNEWHRGASSGDCQASAVCVSNTHWVARNIYLVTAATGYGRGTVHCSGTDIVLGGGSYCTDGDCGDFDYPNADLSGWEQWHRGASSYDCQVYGACLRRAAVP